MQRAAAHGPLRLLFRYDLSPLLPRLHDPLKTIGVLDRDAGELRFVDAPRSYRLHARVAISSRGVERSLSTAIVLDKFGLRRVEPEADERRCSVLQTERRVHDDGMRAAALTQKRA